MADINKNSKKAQVDKGKTMIFVMVTVASVLVVALLMVSKGLWGQASYLGRVADKKEAAVQQLEANKTAVEALKTSYQTFDTQSPNLLGGTPGGEGDRDGSNAALVLDALPSKYDFPAVASSLEKLLFGYEINAVAGASNPAAVATPGTAAVPAENTTGPQEIPFSFEVTTNYKGFKQLIGSFNRSIRPFHITKIELNGTNNTLNVTMEGKTFYQLESGLKIVSEDVQ